MKLKTKSPEDILCAVGTSYVLMDPTGLICAAGGPLALRLPGELAAGQSIFASFALMTGLEATFGPLLKGEQDPLIWPNIELADLAPGLIFDVQLKALDNQLILTLTERTDQAILDQHVMQTRNDLELTKQALRRAREEAELANQSKDQLLLLLRETVREPLTALITATHNLGNDLAGQDLDLEVQAKAALNEGQRLLELLDSLLEMTDGAAGGFLTFVEELQAPRAIQLAKRAIAKIGLNNELGAKGIDADPLASASSTRLSFDPRGFQQLVEVLSHTIVAHGGENLVWKGPNLEKNLWIIGLEIGAPFFDQALIQALQNPSTYIKTGADPNVIHTALLLCATGIACQWQEETQFLRLAAPVLGVEESAPNPI